jgi:hypothetical protein
VRKFITRAGRVGWVGHGEITIAYKILVGRHGGKRQLGRPRHRHKDNIKMDLK